MWVAVAVSVSVAGLEVEVEVDESVRGWGVERRWWWETDGGV